MNITNDIFLNITMYITIYLITLHFTVHDLNSQELPNVFKLSLRDIDNVRKCLVSFSIVQKWLVRAVVVITGVMFEPDTEPLLTIPCYTRSSNPSSSPSPSVCDETQNLNDTDSETFFGTKFFRDRFRDFFRYQFFSRPVSIPHKKVQNSRERDETRTQINTNNLKNFKTGSDIFFRYQIFLRPIPRLFSVPNFSETGSETFFGTNFFRDRFRDFFRYQIFSIPVPIPSKKLKNSREREFPEPGCHTQLSIRINL